MASYSSVVTANIRTAAVAEDPFFSDPNLEVEARFNPGLKRQAIYDLLRGLNIGFRASLDGIIQRQNGKVTFYCATKDYASKLATRLQESGKAVYATAYCEDEVRVVVNRLPPGVKMQPVMDYFKRYAPVKRAYHMTDKLSKSAGKRALMMRASVLALNPIPESVWLGRHSVGVDYPGQPKQCEYCFEHGHTKYECPSFNNAKEEKQAAAAFKRQQASKASSGANGEHSSVTPPSKAPQTQDTDKIPPIKEAEDSTTMSVENPLQPEGPSSGQTTKDGVPVASAGDRPPAPGAASLRSSTTSESEENQQQQLSEFSTNEDGDCPLSPRAASLSPSSSASKNIITSTPKEPAPESEGAGLLGGSYSPSLPSILSSMLTKVARATPNEEWTPVHRNKRKRKASPQRTSCCQSVYDQDTNKSECLCGVMHYMCKCGQWASEEAFERPSRCTGHGCKRLRVKCFCNIIYHLAPSERVMCTCNSQLPTDLNTTYA